MSPYPMELMSPNPSGLGEQPGKASQISVSDTESDNKKSSVQPISEKGSLQTNWKRVHYSTTSVIKFFGPEAIGNPPFCNQ